MTEENKVQRVSDSPQPACSAPWVGKLYHSCKLGDDWGYIKDETGRLIIRVPLPTYDEDVLNEHRRNKTDPTQERVDFILEKLNQPNAPGETGETRERL